MTLESLADRFWKKTNEVQPTVATVRGVHDYDDQLPAFDDEWVAGMSSAFRGILEDARAITEEGLDTQEKITRSLLIHQCVSRTHLVETPFLLASVDPFLGPHTRLLSETRQNTVQNIEQANALLDRYASVPAFLQSALSIHRKCADAGQAPAAASLNRVLSQLDGYLASNLDDDPFLVLDVPGDDTAWRERAEDLVTGTIRPAIEAYRNGLTEHIAPVARPDDRCGLTWMDGGDEIYAHLVEQYTQLSMPPQEIHDVGQRWATEINAGEWVDIGEKAFGVNSMEAVF
ncbi:MAG TPA: DUF885 family protein, partial [Acidimicrobiia bacterium]